MKAIISSISLMFLSVVIYGQTGIYHPISTSGAIWREYFGGYEVNCTDYQISITGDTIIGDKQYQKLQRFGVIYMFVYPGNCLNYFSSVYNEYAGAFRNDSVGKKVFYFPQGGTSEVLLYDFNLNLNDKLPETYYYQYVMDTSFISQIDSVLIGNEYHKRFGVSNSYSINYVYLVEGIGSSFGLLSSLDVPFEFGSTLLCFKQNDVAVYPEQGFDCVLVTGINDSPENISGFTISPNPISSEVGVINMPKLAQPAELVIGDIIGNEVLRIRNVEHGTVINTGRLNPGIYFYKVILGNRVYFTGKLQII